MTYFASLNHDGSGKAEHEGFTLRADMVPDDRGQTPWEECEGHGPVSEWRRVHEGCKSPGELLLHVDNGMAIYYDFAGACKQALAEGWNAKPYDIPGETKRQQAARAAKADFEYLKAWCNDRWHYVGVVVTASKEGIELGSASVWGIESTETDYLCTVANELVPDALEQARAMIAKLTDGLGREFVCDACGRTESECSAAPCPDVLADRAA